MTVTLGNVLLAALSTPAQAVKPIWPRKSITAVAVTPLLREATNLGAIPGLRDVGSGLHRKGQVHRARGDERHHHVPQDSSNRVQHAVIEGNSVHC